MIEILHIIPLDETRKYAHTLGGDELLAARVRGSQIAKQAKREQVERADKLNTKTTQKALDRNSRKRRRLTAVQRYEQTREMRTCKAVAEREARAAITPDLTDNHLVYSTKGN